MLDVAYGRSTAGETLSDALIAAKTAGLQECGNHLRSMVPHHALTFQRKVGSKWHADPENAVRVLIVLPFLLQLQETGLFTDVMGSAIEAVNTDNLKVYASVCWVIRCLYLDTMKQVKVGKDGKGGVNYGDGFASAEGILDGVKWLTDAAGAKESTMLPALAKLFDEGTSSDHRQTAAQAQAANLVFQEHTQLFLEAWGKAGGAFRDTLDRFLEKDRATIATLDKRFLESIAPTTDECESGFGDVSRLGYALTRQANPDIVASLAQAKINKDFLFGADVEWDEEMWQGIHGSARSKADFQNERHLLRVTAAKEKAFSKLIVADLMRLAIAFGIPALQHHHTAKATTPTSKTPVRPSQGPKVSHTVRPRLKADLITALMPKFAECRVIVERLGDPEIYRITSFLTQSVSKDTLLDILEKCKIPVWKKDVGGPLQKGDLARQVMSRWSITRLHVCQEKGAKDMPRQLFVSAGITALYARRTEGVKPLAGKTPLQQAVAKMNVQPAAAGAPVARSLSYDTPKAKRGADAAALDVPASEKRARTDSAKATPDKAAQSAKKKITILEAAIVESQAIASQHEGAAAKVPELERAVANLKEALEKSERKADSLQVRRSELDAAEEARVAARWSMQLAINDVAKLDEKASRLSTELRLATSREAHLKEEVARCKFSEEQACRKAEEERLSSSDRIRELVDYRDRLREENTVLRKRLREARVNQNQPQFNMLAPGRASQPPAS